MGLCHHVCVQYIHLFAFITGNSNLEPLLEDLLFQIHMDLNFRVASEIEPGTCR